MEKGVELLSPVQTKDSPPDQLKLAATCNATVCDVLKTCQFTPTPLDETAYGFHSDDSPYFRCDCRLFRLFVAGYNL